MMEFMFAAQLLSGLWCRWSHRGLWVYRDTHLHPMQGYTATMYDCPKCGEVAMVKRLNDAEARELYETLIAR